MQSFPSIKYAIVALLEDSTEVVCSVATVMFM
jgi:hypothetical protein